MNAPRMDVTEARRTAIAIVRAQLLGDHQAVEILLDALGDDPVAHVMVLTSLAALAHAALAADREGSLRLLDRLGERVDDWPAGQPMPWPGAS